VVVLAHVVGVRIVPKRRHEARRCNISSATAQVSDGLSFIGGANVVLWRADEPLSA
jgi:hypothetical protein